MRGSFGPDNIRSALDASIVHRVTLIDGDKNIVLPGIHVRLGSGHTIAQQFVVIETKAGRRWSQVTACTRGASSPGTTTTASTCHSQQRCRQRLGATQDDRQDE
jgi:hypothetical protein